jgi:signal transduction histidine kinase
MKKLILLLSLLISFKVNAQNAQDIIDGLKKDLKANPDDKKRATIYSDLTYYYTDIMIDSSLVYGSKALKLAKKINDEKLLAQVYSDFAAAFFRKGNFQLSNTYYLKASAIRKKLKDFEGVAKININLASVYTSNQNYKKAVKSYLDAINYFDNKNDTISNATRGNLGFLFYEMNDMKKALKYTNDALKFQENNNLKGYLCDNYLTLGNIYSKLHNNLKSELYYNKCLKIGLQIKDNLAITNAYSNLASLKLDEGKPNQAIEIYEKSKFYLKQLNTDIDQSIFEIEIARGYLQLKKYDQAKKLLRKNLHFFQNQNSKMNLLDIYKRLTESYLQLNKKDSAVYFLKSYHELNDILNAETINKQTAELETKYQTAKKEKQIIKQQAEAKQKNSYLIGLSVLALLIGLIGYLIYKQQKQKNKQQAQENDLKLAIEKIENQNKLQEQRLRISRDLHDNIGSQLTFIISSVDNVKYGFDITNEKLDNKLTHISNFAKETILELRDTIWAMNSNEITYEDLEIRINNFIEKAKLSKENISFSFAIDENLKQQKLSSVEGMNIYRTIQEAINNAIKYAEADIISVIIKQQANQIAINIKDNGKGFDPKTIDKGNGLKNMQKRIAEIGGEFSLKSGADGTKIEILI